MGNIQFISLFTSPLSYPPWDTIKSSESTSPGTALKEKSPAKLNLLSDFKCTPEAVAKAILISFNGLVTGVQTGGGVIGTNISDCNPLTDVKLIILSLPFYFLSLYY